MSRRHGEAFHISGPAEKDVMAEGKIHMRHLSKKQTGNLTQIGIPSHLQHHIYLIEWSGSEVEWALVGSFLETT